MSITLTDERLKKLVQVYLSNGMVKSTALEEAGYSRSYSRTLGLKLYDNIRVQTAIKAEAAKTRAESIATRKQRQEFWTAIMQDATANNADRLRASEILGKSECDFVDVHADATGEARQLDERKIAEARRVAQIRLREGA